MSYAMLSKKITVAEACMVLDGEELTAKERLRYYAWAIRKAYH